VYEIKLLNGKTYKVTELYNLFTVIVTNVYACWNTQCNKHKLILGPKFDTLWENHTHKFLLSMGMYAEIIQWCWNWFDMNPFWSQNI